MPGPDGERANLITDYDPAVFEYVQPAADQAASTSSRPNTGREGAEEVREAREEWEGAREDAEPRRGGPFGGLTASEAASRKAAKARERREQAEQDAQNARLTGRQRLGVSLAKLDQSQLDRIVQRMANDAEKGSTAAIAALARMYDQAFGKAQPAEGDKPNEGEGDTSRLTREERSALIAEIQERRRLHEQASGDEADPRATGEGGGTPPPR